MWQPAAMDESLATQAVLLLFGGVALGGIVGAAVSFVARRGGSRESFMPGMAVGLLIYGACTAVGAARVGWASWQFERGTVAAEGRLLGYEEQVDVDAGGRRTRTLAPRVAFDAADGTRHEVLGLGGSQRDRGEGEAVAVRYRPDAPQQAAIDDFQNRWGAFWAFCGFAGFGLLAGSFFAVSAWSEARPRVAKRRREAGPRAQAASRLLLPTAGLTLVVAILAPAVDGSDDLPRSLAISFGGVAAAMLVYAGALLLSPQQERTPSLMILLILAAGFGFFAFGIWRMG